MPFNVDVCVICCILVQYGRFFSFVNFIVLLIFSKLEAVYYGLIL